jgi:hypothetical protein
MNVCIQIFFSPHNGWHDIKLTELLLLSKLPLFVFVCVYVFL